MDSNRTKGNSTFYTVFLSMPLEGIAVDECERELSEIFLPNASDFQANAHLKLGERSAGVRSLLSERCPTLPQSEQTRPNISSCLHLFEIV